MKQFFAFCVFAFSFTSVFATSFGPGNCPEPTKLAQPFNLEQYLGTWYEIKSTKPTFEAGLRCTQANYNLNNTSGFVIVNVTGVDDFNSTGITSGIAKPSAQDNVFAVNLDGTPAPLYLQHWVVDTDYNNYALVVSCNNVFGFFNVRAVWILSRNPTLDDGIVKNLEAKLDSVGITDTQFVDTVQDC